MSPLLLLMRVTREPNGSPRPPVERHPINEEAKPATSEDAAESKPFRAIYDAHFDFVWSCARRLGVAQDAIDDVVQEVFIVVHARLHTLERPASLRSWIYGVVRRTVSTYHRARRTRHSHQGADAGLDDRSDPTQPSPLEVMQLGEDVQLLWSLLGELDHLKREMLVLVELEEMSVPEVAEAIGVPVNTAYSRLRAARQEFNDAYAQLAARSGTGE